MWLLIQAYLSLCPCFELLNDYEQQHDHQTTQIHNHQTTQIDHNHNNTKTTSCTNPLADGNNDDEKDSNNSKHPKHRRFNSHLTVGKGERHEGKGGGGVFRSSSSGALGSPVKRRTDIHSGSGSLIGMMRGTGTGGSAQLKTSKSSTNIAGKQTTTSKHPKTNPIDDISDDVAGLDRVMERGWVWPDCGRRNKQDLRHRAFPATRRE